MADHINQLPPKKTLHEIFWQRVEKTQTCWLWKGTLRKDGYGVLCYKYKRHFVHRLSLEINNTKLIKDLEIDHLCRVRNCVNPAHLEQVTIKENNLRGIGLAAQNARKNYCKRGHEFTKENTYLYKSSRTCRICQNNRAKTRALFSLQQSDL